MKLFTTTALATLLAASTAIAANHDSGDTSESGDGSMDSSQTDASSSDMSSGEDTSAGASEMYDETGATEGDTPDAGMTDSDKLIRARDITGGAIYTMSMSGADDWDVTIAEQTIGSDWQEIGEIEDIVMSRTGQMTGVVAEIGGFLDIADKHVLLPINDVKLVPADDMTYSIVTRFSEDDLEDLKNIDESPWY